MNKNVFLIFLISFSGIFHAFGIAKKSGLESETKNHARKQLRSERSVKSGQMTVGDKLESNSHLNKHTPKNFNTERRRRENDNMNSNPMLLLDASNGFQRAIQTDIDELNHPSIQEKARKSEINSQNDNMSLSIFQDTPSNQRGDYLPNDTFSTNISGYNPQEDNTTKHEGSGLNDAFGLLSETAQHYSEFIIEEMRYMAEIQKEKHQYSCDYSIDPKCRESNGTHEPSFSDDHERNTSNNTETNISNISDSQPQSYDIDTNLSKQDTGKENSSANCNPWSEWGQCNDTCGNGVSIRYRDCFDKNNTKKPEHEYKSCSNPECLYCSSWSKFSSCSRICGVGIKYKLRTCYLKNGNTADEKIEEKCNFHPCQPECDAWSDWTECSKPCDTGVTIRTRNCTLADGSVKTFYEHHSCNTQACVKSTLPGIIKSDTDMDKLLKSNDSQNEEEDGCISAHINFQKYQYNVYTIFDDTDEHNDVEYKNMVLFDGNHSCGYSGVLTGRESSIKFYDDIFRNFEKSELSVLFWIYPISTYLTENKNQSIFNFNSKIFDYGKYSLILNEKNQLIFTAITKNTTIIGFSLVPLTVAKWHHLAAIFSAEKERMDIYIDGKKVEISLNITKSPIEIPLSVKEAQFQGFGNDVNYTSSLSAVIDEIYVYKCALSRSQIMNTANTCKMRESKNCPSPMHGLCPSQPKTDMSSETNDYVSSQVDHTPLNT